MLIWSTYLATNEEKYSEGKVKNITKIKIQYNKEKKHSFLSSEKFGQILGLRYVEKSWMSLPIEQTLKY